MLRIECIKFFNTGKSKLNDKESYLEKVHKN